jgi:hypothetical protein
METTSNKLCIFLNVLYLCTKLTYCKSNKCSLQWKRIFFFRTIFMARLGIFILNYFFLEKLFGPACSALRRAIDKVKERWSVIGWVTKNLLSQVPPCFGRHVKPSAPTNLQWTRVVGYGPFSLCVIHKEGLCPSSGDINRLMMFDS